MRKVIATNDDKNLRFVQVVEEDTFGDDIRGQITSTYAKRQPFINETKERIYEIHCVTERLKQVPAIVKEYEAYRQTLIKLEEAKMWLNNLILEV
jgi:hypothetical protein